MFYTPKKLPGDMAAISPQFEEKEGIGFLEEAGLQSWWEQMTVEFRFFYFPLPNCKLLMQEKQKLFLTQFYQVLKNQNDEKAWTVRLPTV